VSGGPYGGGAVRFAPDSALVDEVAVSPNIGPRRDGATPRLLVLHYTGLESAARSIAVLCDPVCQVSCHYLVGLDGRIWQMVAEADRAWHAGQSYWRGERDINSWSIGIEIQNQGHMAGLPVYPNEQMAAVIDLAKDILARHDMQRDDVVAHSDIAPQRKIDPGEAFDWCRLSEAGIGHWAAPAPVAGSTWEADRLRRALGENGHEPALRRCLTGLAAYGYEISPAAEFDIYTVRVIKAFQRHYRPALVNGLPDRSTLETLERLLDTMPSGRLST